MPEAIVRAMATRLIRRLNEPPPAQPRLRLRQGIVDDVNENSTLTIRVPTADGVPGFIKNVRCYGGPPPTGASIWFFHMGRGRFLAIWPGSTAATNAPAWDESTWLPTLKATTTDPVRGTGGPAMLDAEWRIEPGTFGNVLDLTIQCRFGNTGFNKGVGTYYWDLPVEVDADFGTVAKIIGHGATGDDSAFTHALFTCHTTKGVGGGLPNDYSHFYMVPQGGFWITDVFPWAGGFAIQDNFHIHIRCRTRPPT